MKDTERRGYEMLARVDQFGVARAADFPAPGAGGTLFAFLRIQIAAIEAKAREQTSGMSHREEGTATRAMARENLRSQLEAISRTAASLALAGTTPGLEDRFRMPRGNNDQALINTARAFSQDAAQIIDRFVGFGLPMEFRDDLDTAIRQFETAVDQQNAGRDTHVAATMAIDDALERGINIVRQLDAIVRNRYAGDAPQLAAWQSASHIERSPQRATQTQPPATPPTP
jgi:hypothetical protein